MRFALFKTQHFTPSQRWKNSVWYTRKSF